MSWVETYFLIFFNALPHPNAVVGRISRLDIFKRACRPSNSQIAAICCAGIPTISKVWHALLHVQDVPIGSCWTNNWACWLTEWTVELVSEYECRGRNMIYLLNGQNSCQRMIWPISSLLGGIPAKRAVYLPFEGLWTVIVKRWPFHVYWETKIKIVAVSTLFRLHNDETERSRHRKKHHDALLTMGNEQHNTIALTLSFDWHSHFLLFD